ncbi:hypothetical protein FA15DRAFT_666590 [Coprinopsis marcescibilis]|uniref:Uncharacterized protein n=1 Tax=Coprinopsis marcescibilis TaxID=230819 RepID=A0A5C3L3H1_COPMA|nr:hypothetical protein FA15DRAFT_666590 [Coprinopsis marcescibilis]
MERADEPLTGGPRFTNVFPASTSHQSPSAHHYHTPYSQLQHPQFASPPLFPLPPSRSAFGREEPHRLEESHLGDAPHDSRLSDVWWRTVIPFLVLVSNATFSAVGELIKSTISITFICLLAAFGPSISMLLAIANLPLRLLRDVHHNLPSLPSVSLSSLKGRWYHKTRAFRPIPPGALNWRSSPTHTAATTTTAQQDLHPTRRTRGARLARDQTPPPEIPAAVPLVKIDLKARLALGAKRNFRHLFELFKPEVKDPEYDAFVERVHAESLAVDHRAPAYTEIHRLNWQGEAKELPAALDAAFPCLISDMTILDCEISVEDVISILAMCPALETLHLRQVTERAPVLATNLQPDYAMLHPLTSLTLTSKAPLDPIFSAFKFSRLKHLSLKLWGDGNITDFVEVFQSFGRAVSSVILRGNLNAATIAQIRAHCSPFPNLEVDIGHVCENSKPRLKVIHRRGLGI